MSAVVSDLSSLIDRRLARLEYDLRGPNHQTWDDKHANETHDKNNTIKTQIARLGNRLKELESQSVQAVDLLKLYERVEVVSLQDDDGGSRGTSAKSAELDQLPTVFAAAPILSQTVSDLDALQRQQIPDNQPLASLIGLAPRLERVAAVQRVQSEEENELCERTAQLLARWYEQTVVHEGEQWADWEARLSKVELKLRREEHARKREEEGS